jgi:uncharacterized membrane protein
MRRFCKTATWSLLAFSVTTIIGYMLTGDWVKGGMIGILCRCIKIPAYYYHDSLYAKHWPATVEEAVACDACAADAWLATKDHAPHAHQPHVEHCNAG